jgi:AcrR family transcriptional regulator
MSVPEGRVFRGRTAAERAAERRERLLEAALDLIGSDGWPAATMTAICRRAGLTERYFYESFRDREALHVALIDAIADEVETAVRQALATPAGGSARAGQLARLHAAARAVLAILLGDPRKGRVALLEGLGSAPLERRRREILAAFETFVREEAATVFGDDAPAGDDAHLAAVALVGAVDELVRRRLDGSLDVTDDALVDHIARLALALAHPDA